MYKLIAKMFTFINVKELSLPSTLYSPPLLLLLRGAMQFVHQVASPCLHLPN